jgi:uncharacterized glyoxalase superfamily protein PhnB
MKFTRLMPLLRTRNLEQAVAFYRDRLGFECTQQTSDWVFVERDDITLMIALPNAHEPFDRPCFTGSLYFSTDDVDQLWRAVKDHTEIVYPLEDFDYGMGEFAIRDSNGYCLQFGKEIG